MSMRKDPLVLIVPIVLIVFIAVIICNVIAMRVDYEFVGKYEIEGLESYENDDYRQGVFSIRNEYDAIYYGINDLDIEHCTYIVSHNAPIKKIYRKGNVGVEYYPANNDIADKVVVVYIEKNFEDFANDVVYIYRVDNPYIVTEDEYEMEWF